jgi:hypothetical protein
VASAWIRVRVGPVLGAIEYRLDDTQQADMSETERTTWLFRNNFKYQLTPDWRVVGKLNHSLSDSSLGDFYDGGYTEAVIGYAYRPVRNDRLSALAKYTYFYNVPTTDQVTTLNTPVEFIQKSHIAALDLTYDVTATWSIGGKYAYRMGQVSLDRRIRTTSTTRRTSSCCARTGASGRTGRAWWRPGHWSFRTSARPAAAPWWRSTGTSASTWSVPANLRISRGPDGPELRPPGVHQLHRDM